MRRAFFDYYESNNDGYSECLSSDFNNFNIPNPSI